MRAFWLLLFCVGADAAKSWIPDWSWLPNSIKRWKYERPECKQIPFVTGVCKAYFKRYSYDPRTGLCVGFVYGGCQKNKNNFETAARCEAMCSPNIPTKCLKCRKMKNSAAKVESCVRICKEETTKGEIKDKITSNNLLELK